MNTMKEYTTSTAKLNSKLTMFIVALQLKRSQLCHDLGPQAIIQSNMYEDGTEKD